MGVRVNTTIHNFSRGMLDVGLRGRYDLDLYYSGCELLKNFISSPLGYFYLRGGTKYLNSTRLNKKSFSIPFKSGSIKYFLEFTDQKMRVWKDDALVESSGSPVEFDSPYLESEISNISYVQVGNVMYLAHSSHEPYKLTRSSETSWGLATYDRTEDPFTSEYPSCVESYESRLIFGMNGKLIFSRSLDDDGSPRYDDFTTGPNADDAIVYHVSVDEILWLAANEKFLAVGAESKILKVTGSTADEAITADGSINVRELSEFGSSNIQPIKYDKAIVYVESGNKRLRVLKYDLLADSFSSIDMTKLSQSVIDGAIYKIAFQKGNPDILWVLFSNGKLAGVTFSFDDNVIGWHLHEIAGPESKVIDILSLERSENYNKLYLFVERVVGGSTFRTVESLSDDRNYKHFQDFYTGNKDSDYERFLNYIFEAQKEYTHLDCFLTIDGSSVGLSSGAAIFPAEVSGSSVNFTATEDVFSESDIGKQIWKKSIDGIGFGRAEIVSYTSAKIVTCKILKDFDSTNQMAAGNWYLTFNSISGLGNYEGQELTIVTDGSPHVKKTVSSGTVVLDYQASIAHVGYGYSGIFKSMNLEAGGVNGPSQGQPKNVGHITVKFLNSYGALVGTNPYKMEKVLFRSSADSTNRPSPLVTGEKRIAYSDSWDSQKNLIVRQDSPLPCKVLMLIVELETSVG